MALHVCSQNAEVHVELMPGGSVSLTITLRLTMPLTGKLSMLKPGKR